jgi:dipeptidyl aminopeptidase/acylaminoacyl peptidase
MKAYKLITIITLMVLVCFNLGSPGQVLRAAAQDETYLPSGFHFGNGGQVHSQDCIAIGVAFDLDDTTRNLQVRILSDGELVSTVLADIYIEGAEGFCEGGDCIFIANLWELITPVDYHEITAQAYDVETDEWYNLEGTPLSMSCVNYDIYTYSFKTGQVERITALEGTGEYNPSWSPDGKYIVHDVVQPLWLQDLYITKVGTQESVPLAGGEGGNDAAWSPDGAWIVFDRAPGDLYRLSPQGGEPELVRSEAVNASWAPNGKMLVFEKWSNGTIRTSGLDGGQENQVAEEGYQPTWSPNGQWIAYMLNGDIWKVRVNPKGVAIGDPILLVGGESWEEDPSWLNDSKALVFTSDRGGDMDLWMISVDGGEPVWLAGISGFGDYNPCVSNNGKFIAWAPPQIP